MRYKLFITFFLILIASFSLKAQHDQFQFSRLDIDNGLSHNWVTCIMKDSKGFMWFGTLSGLNKYDGYKFKVFKHSISDTTSLNDDFIVSIAEGPDDKIWIEKGNGFNIYDPVKETFIRNPSAYLKSINIPDDNITSVKKDPKGNYWFIHAVYGVYKYDPKKNITTHIAHIPSDPETVSSNSICDVSWDSKGNAWFIYYRGALECLNPETNKVIYHSDLISKNYTFSSLPFKLFIDNKDDFWAYVPTYSSGVFYLSADRTVFRHIGKGEGTDKLSTDVISGIIQDDKSQVWIATDHGGIGVLDKNNFQFKTLMNREDDNKSLSQNSIKSMYKDNTGIIWIGTYKKGISYYHENIIKFPLYTHHLSDPKSLPFNDINKFIEDKYGNLWLGTNGGGLIYFDRKNGTFKSYLHNKANANSLCNNVIITMCLDHEQKLWIGTYFGGLDCFDGKNFIHYKHNDAAPGSISEDRVWSILEDSDNKLWVGTLAGGLNLFNRDTKTFTHFSREQPNSIHSNYVSDLLEDKQKNLWVVTYYGIDVLVKKTNRFINYVHSDSNPNTLINNNANRVFQDSRGLIWISTREGISIFNPATQKFRNIIKEDGLPDNTLLDFQEDDAHNMWVSTVNGLSNIIVSGPNDALKFSFINYNEIDGLQGREFTINASCKTRAGELIFGGGNGFNIFRPSDIHINTTMPNLAFTDFQVFNQSLKVGEKINGHTILSQSITTLKQVSLNYDENVFSIGFASLNYFNPDKVKLQYKMEGFNKRWINADNTVQNATYTNLDAGNYTFKVRAIGSKLAANELSLEVHVLPPFWKTPIAYLLYVIAVIGGLLLVRKRGIEKIRTQFELEKEREEAKRMHELDLMKIKFFTNVSHEFRTPLSLIMAPIDKVLKQIKETEIKTQLEFANRNARRLLNLVNQLLDFRKMEFQELKLHVNQGELVGFIKEIADSFVDIGEKKNVSFIFDSEITELNCEFDQDKMERILFNLLSNAFKFTSTGGHVSLLVNTFDGVNRSNCKLQIKVIDTGIGIPPEKREQIFEPFFQNDIPGSMVNQGSGIGLAITKEFVRLYNGTITVDSNSGEGSCFTVTVPLKVITVKKMGIHVAAQHQNGHTLAESKTAEDAPGISKKPTILIVEDNYDFRFYIKDNLKHAFTIIEAADGREGWQKTLALHPNIVVSDISMPEMDGIELCMKIKNDVRTTHIPVVLLTALIGEDQQLKGLETGATDYLTKPFNFEILLSKIKNILAQQENMRKTYQKQVEVKPTEELIESPEEAFLQKLLRLIEANINNPGFSVEELSGEMFVSRYTLYKKILALTGKTPNEFIRHIRLKRAAQLLENGYLTISQICYKVGFKSQKYFVRSFKNEFNVSPSNYVGAKVHSEV
jgi:signal transduction histidine kinase/ligand-binding sensor domain-containing protein/DNA-binding response OmpR family regulator